MTFDNIYSKDNRRLGIETTVRNNIENAWEDGLVAGLHLALVLTLFDVLSERVKQVIDNVGCKYLDVGVVSILLRFVCDFHIKGKDCGILLYLIFFFLRDTFASLEHIFSMDRPDIHAANRNLHLFQEFKQSLKTTNRTRLH